MSENISFIEPLEPESSDNPPHIQQTHIPQTDPKFVRRTPFVVGDPEFDPANVISTRSIEWDDVRSPLIGDGNPNQPPIPGVVPLESVLPFLTPLQITRKKRSLIEKAAEEPVEIMPFTPIMPANPFELPGARELRSRQLEAIGTEVAARVRDGEIDEADATACMLEGYRKLNPTNRKPLSNKKSL